MRWEITAPGWPVAGGSVLIPPGTVLDGHWLRYNGVPLPIPLPFNAMACDQEAYDQMTAWYPEDQWHRFMHTHDVIPRRR